MVYWIRPLLYTASHQNWPFMVVTAPFFSKLLVNTTCNIASLVCPSGHLSAFGNAGPWSLSVGEGYTFEFVSSNFALCWMASLQNETTQNGGCFMFLGLPICVSDIIESPICVTLKTTSYDTIWPPYCVLFVPHRLILPSMTK